jgi:hypothetical protein
VANPSCAAADQTPSINNNNWIDLAKPVIHNAGWLSTLFTPAECPGPHAGQAERQETATRLERMFIAVNLALFHENENCRYSTSPDNPLFGSLLTRMFHPETG